MRGTSSTRDQTLVLDDRYVFPCWSWLPSNPRRASVLVWIRILELEVAEAYGITNGSSQGLEPQDNPFVLDRCFPARFPIMKGTKNTEYPPHLSSIGKSKKNETLWLARIRDSGQDHEGVWGAGCLCCRPGVGQWVLVLLGVLTAWRARQEGDWGMARMMSGIGQEEW